MERVAHNDSWQSIAAVRAFNRFYTRHIGVLQEHHLQSEFSLTEVRVLYELAHREGLTARDLAIDLDLDGGYISRTLTAFEKRGLLLRLPSTKDGRANNLELTEAGRRAFAPLNMKAAEEVGNLLGRLSTNDRERLVRAMEVIQSVLEPKAGPQEPYVIRNQRPGDIGWIVHRHGVIYSQDYGWDERFEALVAEVAANFIQNYDSKSERCWIAERGDERLGCVCLVRDTSEVARLRLLLVEPKARGLGLGRRLVQECIRFARQAGYSRITLWTQSNLDGAIHIYKSAGFKLTAEEPNHDFGHNLTSQTWELELD